MVFDDDLRIIPASVFSLSQENMNIFFGSENPTKQRLSLSQFISRPQEPYYIPQR